MSQNLRHFLCSRRFSPGIPAHHWIPSLETLGKRWKAVQQNIFVLDVTDDYIKSDILTRLNTAAFPQMNSAFLAPFLLSLCFWRRDPAQYCVCALSDTLAVGNEPSDGEWLPTRAECHYEWRLLRACHHRREFITTSDDDNGLCCKWLWMSSVFGKRRRVWLEFFSPYLRNGEEGLQSPSWAAGCPVVEELTLCLCWIGTAGLLQLVLTSQSETF